MNIIYESDNSSDKDVLPALGLAGCLVQGVSEDGVLLLQAGQLSVRAVLQLFLQTPDLFV